MPFQTTNWTLIVRAGNGDSTDARDALAALCETYWYPVYAVLHPSLDNRFAFALETPLASRMP